MNATPSQFIVFSLNDQTYGIEVSEIREVLGYRKITSLPNVQKFVKGIIHLRGGVLPVFDLREKFNMKAVDYSLFHVIIVVEIAGKLMGMIVDEISDVVTIFPENFQPTVNLVPGVKQEYLNGIGKYEDTMIILLNVDRLLTPEEIDMIDTIK